ncbi:MarR family winged helix-turn-helix transcriptional regulator [Jannaschia sp. W003]|uniref:MarR family winged helix-turn-helix transcriptional regulator n=1 Tax=Jannaschia sp. W003 TaxID=2867012 RepID=UPI0021A884AB|nr:MarR family winged helix-turn-helix transcriptional regulator [Jannaschia sp. W003]UWQ20137.1 MarR family winged helix-turn-helix transcriptional regulator [Jannaschia sp. W003]
MGIKPRQARILDALDRMGEVSQKALIESFDVTSGSMSTMIDRMEAAGLVRRRRSARDGRVDLISVTPHGARLLEEVRVVWREMDDLIEAKLGPEKAAVLTELTRELKFALGAKVPPSPGGVAAAREATAAELARADEKETRDEG